MRTYVGADWSASCVECVAVREDGRSVRVGRAEPLLGSIRQLLERIRAELPGDELHVVIEAGAVVWNHLFHAAGAIVHVVDPKQAKRFAESRCSSGAKSDRGDATNLAELGRSPVHLPPAWAPDEELGARIDLLMTAHGQMTAARTRSVQQLREVLRRSMPAVEAELHDVSCKWVSKFLHAVPTPWHATHLTRADYDGILNGTRIPSGARESLWQALTQTEAPWLSENHASTMARNVQRLLDQIGLFHEQIREVDGELDELTGGLDARKLFATVGGIGLHQTAVLLQNGLGDRHGERDRAGIRMGACPVFSGSGLRSDNTPKGGSRMRRSAPPRARRAVYLMGRLAIQNLAWANAMFADARRRGQSAATAFRRIARALLRILTAMIRDNIPYDDARYVAALKAKRVAWAQAL